MCTVDVIRTEIPTKGKGYILIRRIQTDSYLEVAENAAETLIRAGARRIYFACSDKSVKIPDIGFQTVNYTFRYDSDMDYLEKELPPPDQAGHSADLALQSVTRENQKNYLRIYNECFFAVPNSSTYTQEDIDRFINDPAHYQAGLILMDSEAVGIYELSFETDIPEIASVGIVQGKRGRGLGSKTLNSLLELLSRQGYKKACLKVSTANPDAYRLYLQNGFLKKYTISRWYLLDL